MRPERQTQHDDQLQNRQHEQEAHEVETHEAPVPHKMASLLSSGVGSAAARQSAVIQLQRSHGNAYVQRVLADKTSAIQRLPWEEDPFGTGGGTGTDTPAATATPGAGGQQELSGPGGTMSVAGGGADITAGAVNLNAAMVNATGVIRTPTLIADSVVASSYTPGAGNIW